MTCLDKTKLSLTPGILLFLISSCSKPIHYQFTIIDKQSGEQLAARVSVTDPDGRPIPIDGKKGYMKGDIHTHYPYSETAHLQIKAEDVNILNILFGEHSGKD